MLEQWHIFGIYKKLCYRVRLMEELRTRRGKELGRQKIGISTPTPAHLIFSSYHPLLFHYLTLRKKNGHCIHSNRSRKTQCQGWLVDDHSWKGLRCFYFCSRRKLHIYFLCVLFSSLTTFFFFFKKNSILEVTEVSDFFVFV